MNAPAAMVSCVAIITLGAIEIYALQHGVDGTMLAAVLAIIGGIAGFRVGILPQFDKKP